jgi:uncharacterized protein YndB with AHSA1/START domain
VSQAEIEVAAPPEVVWEVLSDFEAWPSWNPGIRWASIEGPVAEGTRFRWRAGPSTITSTLERIERLQKIAWSGRTLGIRAVHVWEMKRRDGGTLVRSEESWAGLLPTLLRGRMGRTLKASLDEGLQHLKVEAERRTGES